MKILDYETNKSLNDVTIYLTPDEAAELADFLRRLIDRPQIHKVFLSQIVGHRLERELTVAIDTALADAA